MRWLHALRSALFVLFMAVTVVPWATAVLIVSIFARGDTVYWLCAGWLTLSIRGARAICGVHWRLHGTDNLPDAPVVLLPKHQSAWETFAMPGLMPRPLCYVFKRELLWIPFFGWAMARMDMIHIDRGRATQAWAKVVRQGEKFMNQGHWVIMFPEGTRAARGERGTYKTGGTRLAVKTGRAVVPVAVTSARCWPRKSFVLRPGVIDVSIGKPIASVGRRPDELMQEVETWIETEMQRLDPQAYPADPADRGRPASDAVMTVRPAPASDPAQLALFGSTPLAETRPPMPALDPPPRADPATRDKPSADLLRPSATRPLAPDPVVTAALPPATAVFRHPAAAHEICLQDRVVGYALKRGRRRSIGFLVGAEGLSVHVPKWIGVRDIESALREKSTWILRKLAEQQARSQRLAAARIDWCDGTRIPFLGEPLALRVDPVVPARGEGACLVGDAGGAGAALHVGLAPNASATQLRDAVQRWLKRRAREVFEARCQVFAARIGVQCTRLQLSSAQTRWGSASADGSIRLNWRLVHFGVPIIDYVVAHELAHLREMNHSPRFWAVVRAALPDFESARDALRDGSVPMFD